jgi:hypothetical protein
MTMAQRFRESFESTKEESWLELLIGELDKRLVARFHLYGVIYLVFKDGSVAQVLGSEALATGQKVTF